MRRNTDLIADAARKSLLFDYYGQLLTERQTDHSYPWAKDLLAFVNATQEAEDR